MAPKEKAREKGKGKVIQEDFDVARFFSLEDKKRFDKVTERNKKFIVEIGIEFGDHR